MNIAELVKRSARRYSDRVCVIFESQRISYGQFIERVYRLANGLRGLGIKKGDNVAILMGNYPEMAESQFALMVAGLVYVRLNPRLASQEYLNILNDCEAESIIVGKEYKTLIREMEQQLKYIKNIIFDGEGYEGWLKYKEIIDSSSKKEPEIEILGSDYYSIRYTSGTTGRPKGILHTEKSRLAGLVNVLIDTPVTQDDVMLHISPLSHGSSLHFLKCFIMGAKNVVTESFNPKLFFETIEKERVTVTYVVPTMIYMLVEATEFGQYDLSSLNCIIYAGSSILPAKLKEAIRKFGNVFHQVYGLGEAPNVATALRTEEHAMGMDQENEKILSSAGRASLLCEVKIIDSNYKEVKPSETGEIIIKTDQLMDRYWKKPKETEERFYGDWFLTGDIGTMDEGGFLYVLDRKDDMIISGGFNIYPTEVEAAICLHPAVSEVSVIGIPHEKWGAVVKAFVVLKKGMRASEQEIIDECKKNIASFKKPQSVEFIDFLPKNSTGKILRRELRAKYL